MGYLLRHYSSSNGETKCFVLQILTFALKTMKTIVQFVIPNNPLAAWLIELEADLWLRQALAGSVHLWSRARI